MAKKKMMPKKEMAPMTDKPMMGGPMMMAMKRDGFLNKMPSSRKKPPFGKKKGR